MMRLPVACGPAARSCPSGGNGSLNNGWAASRIMHARGGPGLFPPEVVVTVKALACELPARAGGGPLARWSVSELAAATRRSGLVASISGSTIWRWLDEDAIRPWFHRSWIFPRDPDFATKAGRILDLYERVWEGHPLQANEFVISADEKTSIQARRRCHPTEPPRSGTLMRVEHEYERAGAWAYLAALDVHQARLFGRCERTTGIAPFDRLVAQVMTASPYREARRVFWIVDNGSSHRGAASVDRLRQRYPNLVLVHGPVHASWLNQIEIYFSIVQRKALTPNDFASLAHVERRLLAFQRQYEALARPFEWTFTRRDLAALLAKLTRLEPDAVAA
jgi:DDE superfamily endonuclease